MFYDSRCSLRVLAGVSLRLTAAISNDSGTMAVIDDFFGKKAVSTNKAKRRAPQTAVAPATATADSTTINSNQAKRQKTVKVESTATSSVSGVSAEDILKTIPDADPALLELSPDAEKMNFFQLKAKQNANANNGANGDAGEMNITDIPEGRENCLNGLTIVFTGALPRLDRTQCEQLASRYGAKVTKSISGKTSLVVIGHDAGPSKVKKIKSLKIKCIDEDGFISLITKMPADGGSGATALKELEKKKELEKQVEKEIEREVQQEIANEKKSTSSSTSAIGGTSKPPVDRDTQLWTDRYAPTDIKQICGNKGNVEMLQEWLATWFDRPHDMKGSSIMDYKAVLISGPPGIGKTTAATLISKLLGYEVIEKNASDFRSKKVLNENLKVCLDNTSVAGFFKHSDGRETINEANNKRFVLLMDEVDGMSSGDNGGVAQIAQFCRTTRTPMILICNDKSLPKMRTLDKCCFDLTWRRPTAREMKSRLMTIAHREKLKLDPNLVDQLVQITHNDIRQIINIMSTVARTQNSLNHGNLNNMQSSWEKEVSLKPFDIIGKFLSNNRLSVNEKIQLYFNDMDIIPLMVHENYRMTNPSKANNSLKHLELLDQAAELISASDIVNSRIRSGEQQWSLLPFHAVMSTLYPASKIQGQITNRINFTSWLGQNSKRMKFDRIVQNLQYHTCIRTKTNNDDLRMDYIPYLRSQLVQPLVTKGADGIDDVLKMMDEYYLTKEDFDNILELAVQGGRKVDDIYKKVPTSVKSAFTRRYNSYVHPTVIYKTGDSVGRGRGVNSSETAAPSEYADDEGTAAAGDSDADNADADDGDDLRTDALIKEVKSKTKAKAKPRATANKTKPRRK